MKVFILIACLAVAKSAPQVESEEIVSDLLDSLDDRPAVSLEGLKEVVDEIVEDLVKSEPLHGTDGSFLINGHYFNFSEALVRGLSNISYSSKVRVGRFQSSLNLHLHLPQISGWLKSFSSDLPLISGNGSANFRLCKFRSHVTVFFNRFGSFRPTKVNLSVKQANVTLEGPNGSEEFNSSLSRMIVRVINSRRAHRVVENMIDNYVRRFFMGNYLNFIDVSEIGDNVPSYEEEDPNDQFSFVSVVQG